MVLADLPGRRPTSAIDSCWNDELSVDSPSCEYAAKFKAISSFHWIMGGMTQRNLLPGTKVCTIDHPLAKFGLLNLLRPS
jgi:hypothetical protein